jgi:hypothetical protein
MGQFSWIKSDDNQPIYSDEGHQSTVYMLSPDGNHFREDAYEGYGVFGGKDAYVFWMEQNLPEECVGKTSDEIRDRFFNHPNDLFEITSAQELGATFAKYPFALKFTEMPRPYDTVRNSESDPDQGWFQEEEEDCYDEDGYWR